MKTLIAAFAVALVMAAGVAVMVESGGGNGVAADSSGNYQFYATESPPTPRPVGWYGDSCDWYHDGTRDYSWNHPHLDDAGIATPESGCDTR